MRSAPCSLRLSRRLSFIVLGPALRNFSVGGPEFLDRPPHRLGDGTPHTLRMAQAEYYLAHKSLCDSEFSRNAALALSGSHKQNSDVNWFHDNS